jgi:hypothetical protein
VCWLISTIAAFGVKPLIVADDVLTVPVVVPVSKSCTAMVTSPIGPPGSEKSLK